MYIMVQGRAEYSKLDAGHFRKMWKVGLKNTTH